MREIKFRAWDDTGKAWLKDDAVRIGGDGQRYYFDKGTLEEYLEDLADKVIIEQFTGLKDRNGKEIYEGDIVKLHCGTACTRNGVMATIKWIDDEAKFLPVIHDKEVTVKGGTSDGEKVRMCRIHSWCGMHSCFSPGAGLKYVEVIGNIHENPELLTEQTYASQEKRLLLPNL